jgi:hypothetical protein
MNQPHFTTLHEVIRSSRRRINILQLLILDMKREIIVKYVKLVDKEIYIVKTMLTK